MKETPIPLDTRSVVAVFNGDKCQLRCVYPQRGRKTSLYDRENTGILPYVRTSKGELQKWLPYGKEGDLLWVQEPWTPIEENDDLCGSRVFIYYKSDRRRLECRADRSTVLDLIKNLRITKKDYSQFQLSSRMPRWASRLSLQITKIRIERLHNIGEADLEREGFHDAEPFVRKRNFIQWWNQNHSYTNDWTANPFVWVIDFEVVDSALIPVILARSKTAIFASEQ